MKRVWLELAFISDILAVASIDDYGLAGTVTTSDGDVSVTAWTSDDFKHILGFFFDTRKFPFPEGSLEDMELAYSTFRLAYTQWRDRVGPDILRAFYALRLFYNPLDNYNGIESHVTEYGKAVDITYGRADIVTRNQTEKVTETPNNYVKEAVNKVYGYNSATAVPSDIMTETENGSKITSKEYIGSGDVTQQSGKDQHKDSGRDVETITRSGNLGVTTSQQMIDSEWNMRRKDFIFDSIKRFFDEYTIY